MAGSKLQKSEQYAKAFFVYLIKQNVQKSKTKALRDLYEGHFTSQIRQVSPDSELPTFMLISGILHRKRLLLKVCGKTIHLAEADDKPFTEKYCKTHRASVLKRNGSPDVPQKQQRSIPVGGATSARTQSVNQVPNGTSAGNLSEKAKKKKKRIAAKLDFSRDNETGTSVPPHDGPVTERSARKRRRKKAKSVKLAVDQHLSLGALEAEIFKQYGKPGEQEEVSSDSCSEPEELPECVKRLTKSKCHKYQCTICSVNAASMSEMDKHLGGKRHKAKYSIYILRQNRAFLVSNKEDIEITCTFGLQDGVIQFEIEEKKTCLVPISIHNRSQHEAVVFHNWWMLNKCRVFSLSDASEVAGKSTIIPPGDYHTVVVSFSPSHVGKYHSAVFFALTKVDAPQDMIYFVRYLNARCSSTLLDDMKPTAPYRRPPRVSKYNAGGEIVEGLPLPRNNKDQLERVIPLGQYRVPSQLRKRVNRGMTESSAWADEDKAWLKDIKNLLAQDIDFSRYFDKFSTLLHLEEIQMEVDIRRYDMEKVELKKCRENGRFLTLQVPGLAEKRPSVLKGDQLYVRQVKMDGLPEDKEYQGVVHTVRLNEVWLGFSDKLMKVYLPNMKFNVRFTIGRLPLRVSHRAAKLCEEHSLQDILFPTPTTICGQGTIQPVNACVSFYDRQLESNHEQATAVRHIVSGKSRPAPYLVFGPPGTGKTVTLVEAMKQVLRCLPTAHILACAPSNSAADLLAERLLHHVPKSELFRMHAVTRLWSTVPESLHDSSNYDDLEKTFYYPSKDILVRFKVIVCTLVTAGRLVSANFPAGHFSHVFVDEAGQAMETDATVPLAGIMECDMNLKDGGQIVLAGDPKQLGPILRSPVALDAGLGIPFLERLMSSCQVYQKNINGGYDSRVLTKLIRNYRSHPSILQIPNSCFYDNELEAHADVVLRECMCRWEELPRKGFPILFHGVVGEDQQEERSPSFFNPQEAALVITYVEKLLAAKGGVKVKEKDIGIITPYRKQVEKIRIGLKKKRLTDIQVGSVEEFQGQEKLVVFISTVRSKDEFLPFDHEYSLGFVGNAKRFNVAITRTKALLIVVGNPHVLRKDQFWKKLVDYCISNGAYTGCDCDNEEEEFEDLIHRFQNLGTMWLNKVATKLGSQLAKTLTGLDRLAGDPTYSAP